MKNGIKTPATYFFEDGPLFGLDIGHDTLRIMQLDGAGPVRRLRGYGAVTFDAAAIKDGVIVRPELIARSAAALFKKELVGDINTRRVAVSLPAAHALSRAVRLPSKINPKDLDEAVQTEAEQYLPGNIDTLYTDYEVLRRDDEGIEVFFSAVPRQIVDSYLVLTRMLGLEVVLLNTTIGASAQLFSLDQQSSMPSVLVDFGATTTDISIFHHGLLVTSTVGFGGDDSTAVIGRMLAVTPRESMMLKGKYGLTASPVQKQITAAMEPSLALLLKEIRRTIRYYEQRYTKDPSIGQVVIMGGGANLPGIADYLRERVQLTVRPFDPARHIDFGELRPFYHADRMSFVTVAGLAVTNPAEVFA